MYDHGAAAAGGQAAHHFRHTLWVGKTELAGGGGPSLVIEREEHHSAPA